MVCLPLHTNEQFKKRMSISMMSVVCVQYPQKELVLLCVFHMPWCAHVVLGEHQILPNFLLTFVPLLMLLFALHSFLQLLSLHLFLFVLRLILSKQVLI
jgi:hypothetical protein